MKAFSARFALIAAALIMSASVVAGAVPADLTDPSKTGVAFAGSAYLVNYYFGVMDVLIDKGVVDPARSHLGGISGGSITSFFTCAGITPTKLYESFSGLLTECVDTWNQTTQVFPCMGDLYHLAQVGFKELVPETSTAYEQCQDRLNLCVSQLNPASTDLNSPTAQIVSTFSNMSDVYSVLSATSYLSCQSSYRPYTLMRGEPVMDGGYACAFEDICPQGKTCIKVGAYYIGPHVKDPEAGCFDFTDLPSDATPDYNDPAKMTAPFAPMGSLPATCPTNPNFTEAKGNTIAPGLHAGNPLNMTCKDWQKLAYYPDKDMFEFIFEQGKRDALYWYDSQDNAAGRVSGVIVGGIAAAIMSIMAISSW